MEEKSAPLAEIHPDAAKRAQFHYAFAQRFLPKYVHANPFNFALHDGVDTTRFVQARWRMMERMAGARVDESVFLRVSDLSAWAAPLDGRPAVMIEMPAPERPGCAFFSGMVLLAPAEEFAALEQKINASVFQGGPRPSQEELGLMRGCKGRYFVAEYSAGLSEEHARNVALLCEWLNPAERQNHLTAIAITREAFMEGVAALLRGPGPGEAA